MAKLYAEITSDKGGRVASKGGNEYLDIDISVGTCRLTCLTVKPSRSPLGGWGLYDGEDEEIAWLAPNKSEGTA